MGCLLFFNNLLGKKDGEGKIFVGYEKKILKKKKIKKFTSHVYKTFI